MINFKYLICLQIITLIVPTVTRKPKSASVKLSPANHLVTVKKDSNVSSNFTTSSLFACGMVLAPALSTGLLNVNLLSVLHCL